ncbi:hypothetical protein [Natronorubrum daqingense]|uniref:Uncharacterized protein n=1 Tax=Natronorubrum daqingense TaxID=588898 RepID=A0A1N7FXI0_9EURY|nr:hypothetical protein [Natronorubrum daqingense]APX98537.1 hypothetical protein BB347_17675 [Natronorubrum daqingense]SIS05032.1 hypothetical protein SAMN05421809_3542 [Natronorubrum daqingense]
MVDLQSAAIGGVVFLVLLFGLYFVVMKTTSLGDDERDSEDTEERLEMTNRERHRRVGFRHRVTRQTPMTQAFMGAILVFLVYLGIASYQIAATGRPTEAAYAGYLEQAVFGMVCVGGGVWFKAKQDRKAGELQIMKEQDEGNSRQTITFDRRLTRETGDGARIVAELKGRQVFGLFWRPRLIADDPKRRDSDYRLPDDIVTYEVPNDDSAVWDEVTGEVTIRAKKVDEVNNPNRPVDYEIVPSERKSKSEIQDLKNDVNELEEELKGEKITNAILSENLSEVEEILTNEEYNALKRVTESREALRQDEPRHQYRDDRDDSDRRGRPRAASSD